MFIEEVVNDVIEVLGREYLGGRIGISVEMVVVSGVVACDAGSKALDREGSKNNSESVERECYSVGVFLKEGNCGAQCCNFFLENFDFIFML